MFPPPLSMHCKRHLKQMSRPPRRGQGVIRQTVAFTESTIQAQQTTGYSELLAGTQLAIFGIHQLVLHGTAITFSTIVSTVGAFQRQKVHSSLASSPALYCCRDMLLRFESDCTVHQELPGSYCPACSVLSLQHHAFSLNDAVTA